MDPDGSTGSTAVDNPAAYVDISIDEELCLKPRECRRCLEACPQIVFMCHPKAKREPGRPATDWSVVAVMKTACTGCGICVSECPARAISLQVTP